MQWLRNLFALSIVLALIQSTLAEDVVSASRAKAALAIAKASRERAEIKAAKEKVAAALLRCQHERETHGCSSDLDAAGAKAKAEGKPLFVWVGMTCDAVIRKEFANAVHVHLQTLNGDSTPRLVVGNHLQSWRLPKAELGAAAVPRIRELLDLLAERPQSALSVRAAVCIRG